MGLQGRKSTEAGFSLVELVIAMTVTLIISGAVFQLVSAGQSAFRREPELAGRQQNIRRAIDIIAQDLYGAGYGLPQFAQVFTDGLDAQGPMGPGGADADELELFAASECPTLTVCDVNGVSLTTREPLSACYNLPSLVILANSEEWHPYWADAPGGGANNSCPTGSTGGGNSGGGNSGGGNSGGGNSGGGDGGGDDGGDDGGRGRGRGRGGRRSSFDPATVSGSSGIVNVARTRAGRSTITHAVITGRGRTSRVVRTANNNQSRNGHVNFPPGQSPFNNPGGPNRVFANPPQWMLVGQAIRYRINLDADGTPNLERSTFGGHNFPDGSTSWQIIANGVEDMQVEYLRGTGWQDTPGATTCASSCGAPGTAELDTVIRRVRVRLSARALAANLTGQTTSAVGDAVRGELVTEIAPRAAVSTLGQAAGDL